MSIRYLRQISFFGEEGQKKIALNNALIIGVGGIGSHIAQQLAYLGVGMITIIDNDLVDETNFNRLIGVKNDDSSGMPKVDIAERNILSINPKIRVQKIQKSFITFSGFQALKNATIVFGCVDENGSRLVLNEFCLAYKLPYIDAASDIISGGLEYGGRIVSIFDDNGCLYCWGEIDMDEAEKYLDNPMAQKDRQVIYGLSKDELGESGPSVVSINGIVASIAVTEFVLHFTGKRAANPFLNYTGSRGIVNKREKPKSDCYYCKNIRGKGDKADLERYLRL
jgi:molybdopterin/thiamine biosynthesis adenylyltransferase